MALLSGLVLTRAGAAVEIAACTERGAFTIELLEADAPRHVENFMRYVERGAYSGTVFHRVVADELVQAGGYDAEFRPVVPTAPVPNEADNGLGNIRGTLAAARAADPDSATSQFFVNLTGNTHLDATRETRGYTVFGRITDGLETLVEISRLPTRAAGPLAADVPDPLVEIVSMAPVDRDALEAMPAEDWAARLRAQVLDAAADASPTEVLAAAERYRSICPELDPAVLLAEAEAAAALERPQRARSALDQYIERSSPHDEGRRRAAALHAALTPGPMSALERVAPGCTPPMPGEIADGATAPFDVMVETQDRVRAFMDDSDAFLECLSIVIDEDGLNDREHTLAVREHNRHVEVMENVANRFNAEVRKFRARE